MAHTNSTQNYGLPQWVGTDKPTFLGDLNSAFADIDARMKINSDDATALEGEVNTLKTNVQTAQENISTLQTGATEQASTNTQLRNLINANADSIDTLNTNLESVNTELAGKQATITGGASSITNSNLTVNRALISDSSGKVTNSSVTSTELERLSGVTDNIQTQINSKLGKNWSVLATATVSTTSQTLSVANLNNYSDIVIELEHGNFTADCVVLPISLFINGNTAIVSDWDGTTRNLINIAYISATQITIRSTYGWSNYTIRIYAR